MTKPVIEWETVGAMTMEVEYTCERLLTLEVAEDCMRYACETVLGIHFRRSSLSPSPEELEQVQRTYHILLQPWIDAEMSRRSMSRILSGRINSA